MSQPRHCRQPVLQPFLSETANYAATKGVRLHSAEQSRELDRRAIASGIPGFTLMQRAGEAAFNVLRDRWPDASQLLILCGNGNNGGDGYVVAALAQQAGLSVSVVALKSPDELHGEAADAYRLAEQAGTPIQVGVDTLADIDAPDLIVDALLGTGVTGAPRGDYATAIEWINARNVAVFSLDMPSGVNTDTGHVEQAVNAEATLSFISRKFGLYTGASFDYCGERLFDDLGLPSSLLESGDALAHLLNEQMIAQHLTPRLPSSHKGHTGHLLVVGGQPGFGGSCIMLSETAVRVGAGLVSLATAEVHIAPALTRCPELMVRGVAAGNELEGLLAQSRVVAIGPGLGQQAWGQGLFHAVIEKDKPTVVDADALHLLHAHYPSLKRANWVLTPHPGEAAMLLETTAAKIQEDRLAAGRALWKRYGGIIVLKGNGTLIISGEGEDDIYLCPFGNPGMASGGMGDVLGGMIAGLLTQGLEIADAARMGVLIHALSADKAADIHGQRGLAASDLASFAHCLVNPST